MLINDIERFSDVFIQTLLRVVAAKQNTKGGKRNTELFTTKKEKH